MNPKTLTPELITEIHDKILEDTHGLRGICPDRSLDGALARIDQHSYYEGLKDIFEIAAMYAIAIAQGHIFNDGNKRTGLMAMFIFLGLNGYSLKSSDDETTEIMIQVAETNKLLNIN